LLLQNVFNV
jgi:hypothetical protein